MIDLVLNLFKGERLTLRNCTMKNSRLDKILSESKTLRHVEIDNVTFQKSSQVESLFEAFASQPNFKYLSITRCESIEMFTKNSIK